MVAKVPCGTDGARADLFTLLSGHKHRLVLLDKSLTNLRMPSQQCTQEKDVENNI
jgi:hypothetical protein